MLRIWLKNGAFKNLGKKSKSQLQPQTEATASEDQAESTGSPHSRRSSTRATSPHATTAAAPPRLRLRTLPGTHALPQHSPH